MTNLNFLTVHSLTALPYSNVNRDDLGRPKSVLEGGVERARISSQALKRAARLDYEEKASGIKSFRSRGIIASVTERAIAQNKAMVENGADVKEVDPKAVETNAAVAILKLTNNSVKAEDNFVTKEKELEDKLEAAAEKASADITNEKKRKDADKALATAKAALVEHREKSSEKNPLVWLSAAEIDRLVDLLSKGLTAEPADFISAKDGSTVPDTEKTTSSLAIAMFGRMFANMPELQNEASVAVGHATTTHEMSVSMDYFSSVDDLNPQGAGHLGQAFHTTGVYYRTFTIDRSQLQKTWSAFKDASARAELITAIKSLILTLPTGKNKTTAPNALPSIVVAEQQAHRVVQQFSTPVKEDDGYLDGSTKRLIDGLDKARAFDPNAFGRTILSGTEASTNAGITHEGWANQNVEQLASAIADWALETEKQDASK